MLWPSTSSMDEFGWSNIGLESLPTRRPPRSVAVSSIGTGSSPMPASGAASRSSQLVALP